MELQTTKTAGHLLVTARGRLDANWADYFTDTFLEYIRQGEHHLVIDAAGMNFLSSAGIRSLVRIYKELAAVGGQLMMINATEFVGDTLRTTGFSQWLSERRREDFAISDTTAPETAAGTLPAQVFVLDEEATVDVKVINKWEPWAAVADHRIARVDFAADSFALGIGSPPAHTGTEQLRFGDFLAACGHVVYQAPDERSRPDYLLPVEDFVPSLRTIQTLYARGTMSHLLRFAPNEEDKTRPVSTLAGQALEITNAQMTVFVILGEIDGLVGATLIKSPTEDASQAAAFPEMRHWLSFSGERIFPGEQALIVGVAGKKRHPMLRKFPAAPQISGHAHAVVFPFQPLQNGRIDLMQQVSKFFNGPPPKALLHLVDDNRPVQGLGESSLIRGAMWCAPVKNMEEEL